MSRFYVGVTDNQWYQFLSEKRPDEVNFWRPGKFQQVHYIKPYDLFLFKLHSPLDYIAGGGFFARHTPLPLSLAWESFGEKNGVASLNDLRTAIQKKRRAQERDPVIGCTLLVEPFFFSQKDWIPMDDKWNKNIVTGKGYDSQEEEGQWIWKNVMERLRFTTVSQTDGIVQDVPFALYETRHRLGQGTFRVLVTDAYQRRCAMTGEKTLPVLEAAHIKPVSLSGQHEVSNGLLLRSDLHILFDKGYLTVDRSHTINVSRRIKEEYENGRDYYALHGKKLSVLPKHIEEYPSEIFLRWHNENIYCG
ncbi:MAG TPA: HNH endonuclease [Candidatus Mcinerneyibacteriales bacterium]|nr:HNH endonuclease [Candidatus Mcinerneyibacteriales bacterium]